MATWFRGHLYDVACTEATGDSTLLFVSRDDDDDDDVIERMRQFFSGDGGSYGQQEKNLSSKTKTHFRVSRYIPTHFTYVSPLYHKVCTYSSDNDNIMLTAHLTGVERPPSYLA